MEITRVEVTTDAGTVEGYTKAIGHNLGPNGELIILAKATTLNAEGRLEATAYPEVIYAAGTWRKLELKGVRGDRAIVPADIGTITKFNSKKAK